MQIVFLFEFAQMFRGLHFEFYLLHFAVPQDYNNYLLKTNKSFRSFFDVVLKWLTGVREQAKHGSWPIGNRGGNPLNCRK